MNVMLVTTVAAALILGGIRTSSAQDAHGFVTAGVDSLADNPLGVISGGLVFDLASGWLSVGGQGDLLTTGLYFGGRVGPIAQVNVVRTRALRLFASGGYAWGLEGGPMAGAGVELPTTERISFRATVQDYVLRVGGPYPYSAHRPSVQFGIAWR